MLPTLSADPGATCWQTACRSMLDERLFADLESYNAEQPRIADQWKLVRGAYKAVPKDKAQPLWTQELPVTGLGAFLMIYIKQVRH